MLVLIVDGVFGAVEFVDGGGVVVLLVVWVLMLMRMSMEIEMTCILSQYPRG
jgi:hypothetical protein